MKSYTAIISLGLACVLLATSTGCEDLIGGGFATSDAGWGSYGNGYSTYDPGWGWYDTGHGSYGGGGSQPYDAADDWISTYAGQFVSYDW